MFEYRAIWNVQGGGTGYSVFHVREAGIEPISASAQSFANALRTGFNSLVARLPDDVIINFDSEARELNVATGTLIGVHGVTPPSNVVGTASGVYAAPSGARVDLITSGIVAGRRLRGRTYMVPLAGSEYTSTGLVAPATRTALNSAFNTFRDNPGNWSLAVWSRTHGALADVISVNAPGEVAILRSRRE
jgi:hypothetical protein